MFTRLLSYPCQNMIRNDFTHEDIDDQFQQSAPVHISSITRIIHERNYSKSNMYCRKHIHYNLTYKKKHFAKNKINTNSIQFSFRANLNNE